MTKIEIDSLGYIHTTHEQVHRGIKVFSGIVRVHQNPAGDVHAANGDFYPIPEKLSTTPEIDEATALQLTQAIVEHPNLQVESSELVIVDPGWYGNPVAGAHLAWHIVQAAPLDGIRQAFFVDAATGEVLDQWSMIHTIKDRQIHDGGGLGAIPGPLARGEGDPATGDFDLDAAYDYYGDTYDYFFNAFGRDSIDGNGMPMIATAHSTAPNCPNAFWNGAQMVFCTGTVTDDIVGHELAHGVTQFTANLIYRNQSGQLNESFSDIWGEMIDLFNGDAAFAGTPGGTPWPVHPTGPGTDTPNNLRSTCSPSPDNVNGVRWLLGEDAAAFGGAIRDMWDPTCRSHPDRANSPLQTCPGTDSGGVHRGSGIPNHAFAMLTDGKTFNGHTVIGIGPIKSGAVWYRALSVYLSVSSDFIDAYGAFNQAAQDLIGTFPPDPRTGLLSADMFSAFDATQVNEALLAVEMDTDGACGKSDDVLASGAPEFCDAIEVVFSEGFENGANGWTVSNSAPLTPIDWELINTDIPFDRAGTVWFGAGPSIGDCGGQDESGSHSLTTTDYLLPISDDVYLFAFSHYMSSEGAWDGGNVKISVNGSGFVSFPRNAFERNPYNGKLRSVAGGNTNPLAGETAWTGAAGGWGTSVINLSGVATGGDTIALRFDFGKDGCTGVKGWYLDDFMILRCPDDDGDGVSNHRNTVFIEAIEPDHSVATGLITRVFFEVPRKSTSDVRFSFTGYADLGLNTEYLDLQLNKNHQADLYAVGGVDCAASPNNAELILTAAEFNALLEDTSLEVILIPSAAVNGNRCGGDDFLTATLTFEMARLGDIDGNTVVDT
ncbi:MAG: M4 family metallopeptidase, partial [Planctomycetota bacterium]|nr:M4 family metallopeptidase [Planctomycetota bacterium]